MVEVTADQVQCGDVVVLKNEPVMVKYIDGPDRIGTFDFHVVDQIGNSHIEIVTGVVKLSL
jgi:hypothetical protein